MMKILVAAIAGAVVLASSLSASALDRRVNIVNATGVDMHEFYASNVGTNNWEEDILGRYILPAGNSVNINIDDGTGYCMYDFRAVFADGDVVIQNRVNVCEVGRFTFR